MATSESTTWSDPETCPFCGDTLASPGAGFVAHVQQNEDCDAAFDTWRERVADDIGGGWTG